jgi:hypothetical protein
MATAYDLIWGNNTGVQGARDKLDDLIVPLDWSDPELLGYFNTAYNEWVRETHCLRDDATSAICQIPILANTLNYPMDSRILQIHNGWLLIASDMPHLDVKTEIWLDRNCYNWRTISGLSRYLLPDYPAGTIKIVRFPSPTLGYYSGSVTFTAATSTIAIGTDTYSMMSNLVQGAQVVVTGAVLNNGANNQTFTVATVGTTSFTVTGTLVNETASAVAISKIVDTLCISVDRLPLVSITTANWQNQALEIRSDYQPYLIDGILREAYQKQDSQCLDVNKANEHRGIFDKNKAKVYNEIQRLRFGPTVLVPNRGRL